MNSISIVVPVYNEEENIKKVIEEITLVAPAIKEELEVIVVDDGSEDNTSVEVENLKKNIKYIKLIRTKHIGQTNALRCGLEVSKGDIIVFMDGDGQNSASDIPKLIDALDTSEVVYGYREKRKDPFFSKVLPSKIANHIISSLFKVSAQDIGCSLKAFDRDIAIKLSKHLYCEGMHRFIPVIISKYTDNTTQIPVRHRERKKGFSKNGFERVPVVIYHIITIKSGNIFPVPKFRSGSRAILLLLFNFPLLVLSKTFSIKSIEKYLKDMLYIALIWLYHNFVLDIINTRKNS